MHFISHSLNHIMSNKGFSLFVCNVFFISFFLTLRACKWVQTHNKMHFWHILHIFKNHTHSKSMRENRQAKCHTSVIWDAQVQFLPPHFEFQVIELSCTWVQQIAGTAHVSSFTMSLFSLPNKLNNACFCIFIILSKRQKGKNGKWKKLPLVHKLQHTKALHARAHTLLSGLVSLSCSQSFIIGTRMRAGYGDSFHTHSHRIRSNPDGIFSYWKLFCLFYFFFFSQAEFVW